MAFALFFFCFFGMCVQNWCWKRCRVKATASSSDDQLCLQWGQMQKGINTWCSATGNTRAASPPRPAESTSRVFTCTGAELSGRGGEVPFLSCLPACLLVWRREHAWVAPRAINRRLSRPSAASLIYGAPPIAPGFIWPLSNTCRVRERSAALAAPLCILNNPDGNCPFPKC